MRPENLSWAAAVSARERQESVLGCYKSSEMPQRLMQPWARDMLQLVKLHASTPIVPDPGVAFLKSMIQHLTFGWS